MMPLTDEQAELFLCRWEGCYEQATTLVMLRGNKFTQYCFYHEEEHRKVVKEEIKKWEQWEGKDAFKPSD